MALAGEAPRDSEGRGGRDIIMQGHNRRRKENSIGDSEPPRTPFLGATQTDEPTILIAPTNCFHNHSCELFYSKGALSLELVSHVGAFAGWTLAPAPIIDESAFSGLTASSLFSLPT